jgi:hypothetical protein
VEETKLEKIDSEMQSKRQCIIVEEVGGKKLKGIRDWERAETMRKMKKKQNIEREGKQRKKGNPEIEQMQNERKIKQAIRDIWHGDEQR